MELCLFKAGRTDFPYYGGRGGNAEYQTDTPCRRRRAFDPHGEGAGAQSRSGGPGETAAGDGDPSGGPDDDDQPGLLPGGGGESAGEYFGRVSSQRGADCRLGANHWRPHGARTDGAVFSGGAPVKFDLCGGVPGWDAAVFLQMKRQEL